VKKLITGSKISLKKLPFQKENGYLFLIANVTKGSRNSIPFSGSTPLTSPSNSEMTAI